MSAAEACTAKLGGSCALAAVSSRLEGAWLGACFWAIRIMDLRATPCATLAGCNAVSPAACFSSRACSLHACRIDMGA